MRWTGQCVNHRPDRAAGAAGDLTGPRRHEHSRELLARHKLQPPLASALGKTAELLRFRDVTVGTGMRSSLPSRALGASRRVYPGARSRATSPSPGHDGGDKPRRSPTKAAGGRREVHSLMVAAGMRSFIPLLPVAAGVLACWAPELWGVQALAGPDPVEGLNSVASQPDVFLLDSFEAEEQIAKAIQHAGAGRWLEAAQVARRVIEGYGATLTPAGPGAYTSVSARVNRLVGAWAPPGRDAFRALTELEARRRLDQARDQRDLEALLLLAERYFCTPCGAEAAMLAAELALEAGDFAQSAALCRRLLDEHPDAARLEDQIAPRLAVVYALAGRGDASRELVDSLGPDPHIDWMGQSEPLGQLVETLLREVKPRTEPSGSANWPTFGGDYGRSAVASLDTERLAVLWETGGVGEAADVTDLDESSDSRRALRRGQLLSVDPVLADGLVFLQDSRQVWAVNAANGNVVWRYESADEQGDETLTADSELPQWHAPTVVGSRLYACLGSEVTAYYGYEAPQSRSALVCLDAACGDLLWRLDRSGLGPQADELAFESTPVVIGERLYAIVRRKRAFGFEDCFLYRLSAHTGEVRWQVHLGSASTGGFGYRRPTLTIPSSVDNTVYVVTNVGTFAAVDAYTGLVRWLRLYDRIGEAQWRREGRGASRSLNPWQYNPVVCTEQHLYALPTDGDSLLVLDRATGQTRYDVPLGELALVQTLLGVDGPRIYGVGDSVFCYDLEAGSYVWQTPLPEEGEVMGRGLLTGTQILVPLQSGLCSLERTTGLATVQAWDSPAGGGNLLAAGGVLFVTRNDGVTAYARKGDVLGRLRDQSRLHPDDPLPSLELAEVLFRADDVTEVLAALDEAVARAGGFAGPIEPGIRRRLFDDCLGFARKLADAGDADPAVIEGLYQRASQCPPDTPAHLAYRFNWAQWDERAGRWSDAAALYQQILADRSLATANHGADADEQARAGDLAESAIARLIVVNGRQVYARFDAQAADWLAAARSTGDVALLDRLLQTLPNSASAPQALELRADLLRRQGRLDDAARDLITVLTAYRADIDPPAVMVKVADCYHDAGRPDLAWRWLTRAIREHPAASVDIDGRPVRLLDHRARLGLAKADVEPPRPRLGPPLDGHYQRGFDAACHLLDPRFPEVARADWRDYLVYSAGLLHAFGAQSNAPTWLEPVACPDKPDLLVAAGGRVLLATQHHVFCLEADTGRQLWELGQRPQAVDHPNADPEDFAGFVAFGFADGVLAALRNDETGAAVEIDSGRRIWERRLEHRPAGPIATDRNWVVYQAVRLGGPLFAVLNASDGELVRTIDPQNDRQVTHVLLTPDNRLLLVTTETVQCFDPADGRLVWQVVRPDGVLAGGVALDLDGICLANTGRQIEKLSLTTGRTIWRTDDPDSPAWPDAGGIGFQLAEGQLVVGTDRRVVGVSLRDGRLLWDGVVRRGAHLRHHLLTDAFLVAVDSPPEQFQEAYVAHFFPIGLPYALPAVDETAQALGAFEVLKRVSVRDGAVLVQTSRAVQAWTSTHGRN